MGISSTLYRFHIDLSDIDRGVYSALEFRVPLHPSEDMERVVVRVLARAILHEEGLEFGRGLSHTDDPALWVQTPTGVAMWVDVGAPSADRLHRASKLAERVVVVTHKVESQLRKEWSARSVHRSQRLEVIRLPVELVRDLAQRLERTVHWYVTLQEDELTIACGEDSVSGALVRTDLAALVADD